MTNPLCQLRAAIIFAMEIVWHLLLNHAENLDANTTGGGEST